MKTLVFPATPIDTTGLATEAKQDVQITEAQSTNTKLDTIITQTADVATQTTLATLATEATVATLATEATVSTLATETTASTIATNTTKLQVKEVSSFLDASSTNIPASSSNPVQIIASTANTTLKIQSVEDIGEFIGLYKGAALSEVLVAVLPLGGGEVEVNIPAGTRISLRNMKNATISVGNLVLNLLG